jgi:xylan 1,4-beta-xylosidase
LLTLHGIPKPTYRAFELLHHVGTRQWLVDGLHETVDCSVIGNDQSLTILLTNHTTPGHSIETENIELRLEHAHPPAEVYIQRIDAEHANPKSLWEEMGQPEYLSKKEVDRLEEASSLVKERQSFRYRDNAVFLKTKLPPHAMAAITVSFKSKLRVTQSK